MSVGNDVWIGRGARILSGVTIGDGAVIGGYSVVSKDVDPYTIVACSPAHVVRPRFPEATSAALLRIRWWEWPDEVIADRVEALCSAGLEGFVAAFDAAPDADSP